MCFTLNKFHKCSTEHLNSLTRYLLRLFSLNNKYCGVTLTHYDKLEYPISLLLNINLQTWHLVLRTVFLLAHLFLFLTTLNLFHILVVYHLFCCFLFFGSSISTSIAYTDKSLVRQVKYNSVRRILLNFCLTFVQ